MIRLVSKETIAVQFATIRQGFRQIVRAPVRLASKVQDRDVGRIA